MVTAVAAITTADSINLGDGTRDAVIYTATTALNSTGVVTADLASLNAATGVEAVGTSAASVTAIDMNYFNQSIFILEDAAQTANIAVTDIQGDTLVLERGITGTTGDALSLTGEVPGTSITIELNGSAGLTIASANGTATDSAIKTVSGVSTVNIVSSTTATSAQTNTISTGGTATGNYTIENDSASNFVLTGSSDFTLGAGASSGFSAGVNFNASAFTGKLTITGSDSADIIVGGSGNDTITGDNGNDILTGGSGADTFIMLGATIASGSDTITDFSTSADIIDLGYQTVPTSLTTATMTGAATIATNTIYTVNYGAAIGNTDFTVAGATGFGLLFGTGKAFGTTVALTDDFMVIVQGTDKTVILAVENAGATTLASSDIDAVISLTGVTSANTFGVANFT